MRAELLEKGGVPLWNAFMDELRYLHLGAPRPTRSVVGELQVAYEKALASHPSVRNPGLRRSQLPRKLSVLYLDELRKSASG